MGTYQVNPGFYVGSVGTWKYANPCGVAGIAMTPTLAIDALISNDGICARREGDAASVANFFVRSAINFLIDGVSTGRQSYPAGFWIHDVTCHYLFTSTDFPTNLMLGSRILTPQITSGGSPKTAIYTIDDVDLNFIHRVLNDGFGWDFLGGGIGQIFKIDQVYLTGTWDYWSTQFTLEAEEIAPGENIIINDGEETLEKFHKFYITYVDPVTSEFVSVQATIVSQSAAQTIITIPLTVPAVTGLLTVSGLLDGLTDFGEVIMGTVTIIAGDLSGIYTIVPGKRNDTIYNRNTGGTVNTAIPTPRAKTAFIE